MKSNGVKLLLSLPLALQLQTTYSHPLPDQVDPVDIAHAQQQFQITILQQGQGARSGAFEALVALPEILDAMISQQAGQHSDEFDLGEFGAGAILWPVGPGEVVALLGGHDRLVAQFGG
jgi:hypothetical protein